MRYINPQIQGWMSIKELEWLYESAKKMESVVEIGSWKGRSTHALLSGCKGTVWAIDHFGGSSQEEMEHLEVTEHSLCDVFKKNVGHFPNLKLLKMESKEAVKRFKDKSVDMVFIDGAHTYMAVLDDIQMWLSKTKRLICGHDYFWPGVWMAVNDMLGDIETADTIWFKKLCQKH